MARTFGQNLLSGTWVQTSYNNNFRLRFAPVGERMTQVNDVFLYPQPYPSWTLNSDYEWEAPVPYPSDGGMYEWSEEDQEWVLNGNAPFPEMDDHLLLNGYTFFAFLWRYVGVFSEGHRPDNCVKTCSQPL